MTTIPGSVWIAVAVVLVVVAWFNLVMLAPARWRTLLAPTGVLAAAGVGAAWLFAGLSPTVGLVAAVPWTLGALAASATVVAVIRSRRDLGTRLSDRRIRAMSGLEFRLHVLVRIPLLVALPEEILFRGVAWSVLADVGGDAVALVGSSVAFGLGHLADARAQARREGHGVARWVVITILATGLAGILLGALRWMTGGIWASVGVHAVVNATVAWGARHAPEPTVPAT